MTYADYAYYSGPYGGSEISEDAFAALARRASAFIDRLTYGRAASQAPASDAVKMATCAVVDAIKEHEAAKQQAVSAAALKSETVGGWSGTYQDPATAQAAIESAMTDAARPYLIYTGLMDRSVGGGCR